MYIHIFSINFTVLKYVQYAECLLLETEMTDANINVKPFSQICWHVKKTPIYGIVALETQLLRK